MKFPMRALATAMVGMTSLGLNACALIIDGDHQDVLVTTYPSGATCTVSREGQMLQRLPETPALFTIERRNQDMVVQCQKEGYDDGAAVNPSKTNWWILGNIIWVYGAPIGVAIDFIRGSWNRYEAQTQLTLRPNTPPRPPAADEVKPPALSL